LSGCSRPATQAEPPVADPNLASFRDPNAYPALTSDSFWAPDRPKMLGAQAFGLLEADRSEVALRDGKPIAWSVGAFELQVTLPEVPAELPVYQVGSYPAHHQQALRAPESWSYSPELSLVMGQGPLPLPKTTGGVGEAALAFLRPYDLLPSDSREAVIRPFPEAGGEAWQALQEGKWIKPGNSVCQDGGRPLEGRVESFAVKAVELVYWEPASTRGRQPMLPYYVFRSLEGYTVYVPALRPEWIKTL
jgi:hypothetical protein